jgi:uncharacterized protein (DUF1786 family)
VEAALQPAGAGARRGRRVTELGGGRARARERRGACGAAPLGAGPGAAALAVDVGTGTADILIALPNEPLENAVRLVVPARTQVVAQEIDAATASGRAVVLTGPLMGGGASGAAMKRHLAAGLRFVVGESAALTFADDLERVRALGAEVVADADAADLATSGAGDLTVVRSGDLDVTGLLEALARLGVRPRIGLACVAAQDHGFSPNGSNRVFRFEFWERAVAERRPLAALFYARATIPAELTRLRAAAALAAELAGDGPVLAADTGPAALYGALPTGERDVVLVNVGNGHTVCAVARGGRLSGVFEHHTPALDGRGLEWRLRRFLAGELSSAEVRDDGGHGAVLAAEARDDLTAWASGGGRASVPAPAILVTGPRREMLRGSGLPLEFVAPHGDMMLTGCHGLLRAAGDRGLWPASD